MKAMVDVNGVQLQVYDHGAGLPVLFVHGFPLNHAMWREQLFKLEGRFRLIAPDLRGFGASGVTEGTVTMEQYADDLAALLDALNIDEPVAVCGLSMGGYVAWQFAVRHAERLRALILCDTRAIADTPEGAANRHRLAETVVQTGSEAVASTMLPSLFSPSTIETNPGLIDTVRRTVAATSPLGIAAAARGMAARPDMTERLATITVPTLLIVGEHDRISTVAEMQSIADQLPNAHLEVIPDAGHLAPLENHEPVNEAIQTFLRSLTSAAADAPA